MSIHSAIASHLLHDSRVAWQVENRVYRTVAPRDAKYPYVTYQRITERRARHYTAASGLLSSGIQIDCWSDDSNEALKVADAVRRSLDGLNHATVGRPPNDATVKAAFLDSSADDFLEPSDGSDRGIYRVIQNWDVWHTETVPELAV